MRYLSAFISFWIAGFIGFYPYLSHTLANDTLCSQPTESSLNQPEPIRLQGGCISPSAPNNKIRLDFMKVTIRGKRDSYSVDADYHLFNTGGYTTLTVGVPKYGRADECDLGDNYIVCDFLGFEAWINGEKEEFVEISDFFTDPNARPIGGYCRHLHYNCVSLKDGTETRWMSKNITFPEKATTTIRIRYEARYHNYYFGMGNFLESGYYLCSTAKRWKGKIRKAIFIIDTTEIGVNKHIAYGPGGLRWAPTNAMSRVEIRDYEPEPGCYHMIPGSLDGGLWRGSRYSPSAPMACD